MRVKSMDDTWWLTYTSSWPGLRRNYVEPVNHGLDARRGAELVTPVILPGAFWDFGDSQGLRENCHETSVHDQRCNRAVPGPGHDRRSTARIGGNGHSTFRAGATSTRRRGIGGRAVLAAVG